MRTTEKQRQMKRTIIACAALAAGILAASAQEGGAKVRPEDEGRGIPLAESQIPGIYQLTGSGSDVSRGEAMPFLKIYNPDGSFYTILAMPLRTQPAIITTSGTYRVLSERQLVESLGESVYGSHHAGDDNRIDYVVKDDIIYFVFPSGSGVGREAWHTVCRPAAARAKRTPARAKALAESLEGVWQLCYNTDEGKRIYAPIYKIYRTDGMFVTVNITSQDGAARVSAQGRYAVKGPQEYSECVTESVTDPDLVGVETSFECVFTDGGRIYMRVSFTLPEREGTFTEEWARVIPAARARNGGATN